MKKDIIDNDEESIDFLPMAKRGLVKDSYPKLSTLGKFKVSEKEGVLVIEEVKHAAIFWSLFIILFLGLGFYSIFEESGLSGVLTIEAMIPALILFYYSLNIFKEVFSANNTLIIDKPNKRIIVNDIEFDSSMIKQVKVAKNCVWKNCFYQPYIKIDSELGDSGSILKPARFVRKFSAYVANEINEMIASDSFVDSKIETKDFLLGYLIYYILIFVVLGALVWAIFLS